MERGTLAYLLLALTAAAASVAHAQSGYEGDTCTGKDGGAGICRNITNCPEARAALLKGETPTTCSFDGFTPIVCCPSGGVATRMCEKYAEAVFRYEKTFQIIPQTVKLDQCAIKALPLVLRIEQASLEEFPHMALLGFKDKREQLRWSCGGSLISERFVLTAAHCLLTPMGSPKLVRLGELNLNTTKEPKKHEEFEVAQSLMHPEYEDGVVYNDVGLLRLARDVTFTASIRPACLHTAKEIADEYAIATGWGYRNTDTTEKTAHLKKIKLQITNTEACKNAYTIFATSSRLRYGITEKSMVCAGTIEGGKDTCYGDSGGPLQLKLVKPYCMYSIVGITSFGRQECGNSKFPGVYSRVSYFVEWIESVVWLNEK